MTPARAAPAERHERIAVTSAHLARWRAAARSARCRCPSPARHASTSGSRRASAPTTCACRALVQNSCLLVYSALKHVITLSCRLHSKHSRVLPRTKRGSFFFFNERHAVLPCDSQFASSMLLLCDLESVSSMLLSVFAIKIPDITTCKQCWVVAECCDSNGIEL